MEGRIQNRALIQQAANVLNVEGVKRFPAVLDLGDIKATFNISQPLVAEPNSGQGQMVCGESGTTSVDGAGEVTQPLILVGDPAGFCLPYGSAYRVMSIFTEVAFNAAGALALNGKVLRHRVQWRITNGDPGLRVPIYEFASLVQTLKLVYMFGMRGSFSTDDIGGASSWGGEVPNQLGLVDGVSNLSSNWGLEVVHAIQDGTVFPAATTILTKMSARRATNNLVPLP